MASDPVVLVQTLQGGSVEQRLRERPAPAVASGEVVVETFRDDGEGGLDAPRGGRVVLSVASPEALVRDREALDRALAWRGTEPAVVVVEVAEELRDDELAAVVEAARGRGEPVVLRVEHPD